jgi:hypothetical protein
MDGYFDAEQEKVLRSRKAMHQAKSEEEKWKIVYRILFPDTGPDDFPSPCRLSFLTAA